MPARVIRDAPDREKGKDRRPYDETEG
jgi:hypothetical protein